MNPILKNVIAVVVGVIIGAAVNMGLIISLGTLIPPPEGVDPSNMESIKENIHLFEFKHLMSPFIAHALGTLVGAFLAAKIGASHNKILALIIGAVFLYGGISMVMELNAPAWFEALDLIVAYIPMALLGWKLSGKGTGIENKIASV